MTAVFDSGSQRFLLRPDHVSEEILSTAGPYNLKCVFGSNHTLSSDTAVQVGLNTAHIVPGVADSLFSPDQLLDSGSIILMKKNGGVLFNDENSKIIPIHRMKSQWRVFLSDIKK